MSELVFIRLSNNIKQAKDVVARWDCKNKKWEGIYLKEIESRLGILFRVEGHGFLQEELWNKMVDL